MGFHFVFPSLSFCKPLKNTKLWAGTLSAKEKLLMRGLLFCLRFCLAGGVFSL
jgi:hypothetical protein